MNISDSPMGCRKLCLNQELFRNVHLQIQMLNLKIRIYIYDYVLLKYTVLNLRILSENSTLDFEIQMTIL